MMKVFDTLCAKLELWLRNAYPDVEANTLWIIDSDNGIAQTDMIPGPDSAHNNGTSANHDGKVDNQVITSLVLPPTMDGTISGEQYHRYEDAKGSCHDEGIINPMIVWGAMLPEHVRGVDCPALIEAVDLYPTLLDMLAPPVHPDDTSGRKHWKDELGPTDLAKVDGISFIDTFFDISAGKRKYAFSQVYGPASCLVGEETWIERCVVNRAGWKLHRSLDLEPPSGPNIDEWKLYNLNDDPREKVDLYASTDSEAVKNLSDLTDEYNRIMA